ncbi:MAG: heparinase II/III family protein [Saprospiraceae bacterium]|nr:heparinase II/III family protein [Saprospiraceae bacterium]
MTVGGSLMCLSAVFDDGEDTRNIEPYFTGSVLKLDKFLHKVTDSKDGAWGEGFGYNGYSFSNLSYSLPSIDRVFNIDLSGPLPGTYNEYIWAGYVKNKRWFEYGDSKGEMTGGANWAYLLSKNKEPRLSWFCDLLQQENSSETLEAQEGLSEKESYEEVIFNTTDIPKKDPFSENPVRLFREIGTTVFKSGWETDDFVFVMRTGPAYNHQHLDQGSFWLADRGQIFVQERPLSNSHYYDDPIYESWLTQPVGHSTILVNGNHQSQRVGDHRDFAPGFNDYAFVSHFLDGQDAAFVTGDIGRLYWGKVADLSRNVLYLKPSTLLMLDVAVPSEENAEITLLYQAEHLSDIQAGAKNSSIVKDDVTLHLRHLTPSISTVKAVETPHYLRTLQSNKPLEREGMLTVSARTDGRPLVIANLLTTSTLGNEPVPEIEMHDDVVLGSASGSNFAFSTRPGSPYQIGNFTTDALAITWNENQVFGGQATIYQDENIGLKSSLPITFEFKSKESIKYYIEQAGELAITLGEKPVAIFINNQAQEMSAYDAPSKTVKLIIPAGEGFISIR